MKKKLFVTMICVVMMAIAIVGGTMAYFTDTDAQKNVMTTGKVDISQLEQQRGADGTLVDFVQNKALMPAVYTIPINENNIVVDGYFNPAINNVVDKIITVKNEAAEGAVNQDAFVRTILAFETNTEYEAGTSTVRRNGKEIFNTYFGILGDFVKLNRDPITINGTQYVLAVKVYEDALKPQAVSAPSLKQIFMSPQANNEVANLFGNEYTILALSQGTQTAGFSDANNALDTAFGNLEEVPESTLVEWFSSCVK